jgi:hypothetical protein
MISNGPNLGLLINAATGDQHDVAFRKLLRAVDALVLLMVKSRTLTAPPGSPANGDRYIVGPSPTGAWSGHANAVAVWTTDDPATPLGYWEFHTPAEGWLAWSQADAGAYAFTSGAWAILINPASLVTSVAGRSGAVTLAEADVASLTTDLAATEKTANKGAASGYASLDGTGHVPLAQIPPGIAGALQYQGTWNATTNSPALANGVGTQGFFYKVATAGATVIDGNGPWNVGDLILFDGTVWDKIDNYEAVTSVAGRTGAIVLTEADIASLTSDLGTLTSSLSAEATARSTGDASTLATASALVTAEATARATADALLAPKASPALTGTPTAPTPAALDNSTKIGTTAYTDAAVTAQAAATTTAIAVETTRATTAEALLAPKASPALTGTPTAPTPAALDNSTKLATTAYDDAAVAVEKARAIAAEALLSPLANPINTGSEKLQNPTLATSTVAQSSPISSLSGQFWNGSASAEDLWTFQSILTNGTNGPSTLTIGHSGSTGAAKVSAPNLIVGNGSAGAPSLSFIADATTGFSYIAGSISVVWSVAGVAQLWIGSTTNYGLTARSDRVLGWSGSTTVATAADTGLSRLGAASLAIGNGTAGDFTGSLKLGALSMTNGTVATVSSTNASPLLTLSANYWATGAVSAADTWTLQTSLAAGLNGISTLTIAHAGSTGVASVALGVPSSQKGILTLCQSTASTIAALSLASNVLTIASPSDTTLTVGTNRFTNFSGAALGIRITPDFNLIAFGSSVDTGISRTAAGVLAIGNGTAADASGTLKCAALIAATNTESVIQSAGGTGGATIGFASNSVLDFAFGGSAILRSNLNSRVTYLTTDYIVGWGSPGANTLDVAFTRLAANSLAIGNGTAANASGKLTLANLKVTGLAVYANNAAAIAGGLSAGDLYRTGADPDPVCVVH